MFLTIILFVAGKKIFLKTTKMYCRAQTESQILLLIKNASTRKLCLRGLRKSPSLKFK